MAITSYAGAISDTAWTTDKARVTTGVNSVTFQVKLAGKPTSDANDFLYNNGTVTSSVPLIIKLVLLVQMVHVQNLVLHQVQTQVFTTNES